MSKLIETLKNAGWVETTLGECQVGDEVLLTPRWPFPRPVRVTQPVEWVEDKAFVGTSDGGFPRGTTTVLRAPREGWDDIDDPNEVPQGIAV